MTGCDPGHTAGFRGAGRSLGMRLRPSTMLATLVAPLLVALLAAAPAPAEPGDPVTIIQRDVEATLDPGRHEAGIRAFEGSAAHRALLFQADLAGDLGMRDAPWPGTHNSFNSIAEMGTTLSDTDSNQQLTLVDQLRLGVRSLELDVHWFLGRPVVCHAQGDHSGCSLEKTLQPTLEPVAAWLRAHPDQVLLLYAEDHLDGAEGHDAGAAALRAALGDLLYAPPSGACTELPGELTRDDVLAAGAQVVVVSDCGEGAAWQAAAFAWDEHVESRPVGFQDFPACGPDFDRATYDTRLVRYFEDSTGLTNGASYAGAATRDDGITPQTAGAMWRCGVDLLGLDQLVPGDGRLEALVWTWASGEPGAGDCTAARASDGRWATGSCVTRRPAACRTAAGAWSVSPATTLPGAARACARTGATFAVPRTAHEQALLRAAAGGREVLLGLRRDADGFAPLDAR
jgi:hypothetical protein